MRYWIHWNDLVQGPFELDELVALRAFSEELPVCMENAADWLPASRVADFAPAIDVLRSRRMSPTPPPPPAPTRAPARELLQGEFFGDTGEQWTLFDLQSNGFRSSPPSGFQFRAADAPSSADESPARYTSPIRFSSAVEVDEKEELPGKSAIPEPEVDLPPRHDVRVSPERDFPNLANLPLPRSMQKLPPAAERRLTPPGVEPVPDLLKPSPEPPRETKSQTPASVARPEEKIDSQSKPTMAPESASPKAEGLPTWKRPAVRTIHRPVRKSIDVASLQAEARTPPDFAQLPEPPESIDEEISGQPRHTLVPWLAGGGAVLLLVIVTCYLAMDHFTSRSAIAAANVRKSKKSAAVPVMAPTPAKVQETRAPIVDPMVASETKAENPPLIEEPTKPVRRVRRRRALVPAAVVSVTNHVNPVEPSKADALTSPIAAMLAAQPEMSRPASPESAMTPVSTPAPVASQPSVPFTTATTAPDSWAGRQNDAIKAVMSHSIILGKTTIEAQAKALLDEMHDKELLHAADTGERLYLPDKLGWSALRQGGSIYRVYLNFSALQGNGERAQTRSCPFIVDLAKSAVSTDDDSTDHDFLTTKNVILHKSNTRASDIESILSAVDLLNKEKLRAMIVRRSKHNKAELRKIETSLNSAQHKLDRALGYFRTQYPQSALSNVAKAYEFLALVTP